MPRLAIGVLTLSFAFLIAFLRSPVDAMMMFAVSIGAVFGVHSIFTMLNDVADTSLMSWQAKATFARRTDEIDKNVVLPLTSADAFWQTVRAHVYA